MLTEYHIMHLNMSDAELASRAKIKEKQLRQIFATLGLPRFLKPVVNVAVLGSADRRLVEQHNRIFSALFGKPVALTTFDKNIEHLQAASGVVQHDVTLPLPSGPYDVIYSDMLLRFIAPEKQLDVLSNAYQALTTGGMAIHVLDQTDYHPELRKEPIPGAHPIDMTALQLHLNEKQMFYSEIPLRLEIPKPGTDDLTVVDEFALVFRKA